MISLLVVSQPLRAYRPKILVLFPRVLAHLALCKIHDLVIESVLERGYRLSANILLVQYRSLPAL